MILPLEPTGSDRHPRHEPAEPAQRETGGSRNRTHRPQQRNRTFTAGRSHGVPNVDADYAYEYGIYVHRDDYEKAQALLF